MDPETCVEVLQPPPSELLQVSSNLLYIFDLRAKRNVFIGPQVHSMLGYSPQEIHAFNDGLISKLFHEDDIPAIAAHHSKLSGSIDDVPQTIEYRIRHKSGDWRWLVSSDVVYQRDVDGVAISILGSAQDITPAKLAAVQVKAQRDAFQSLLQQLVVNSPFGVYLIDDEFKVLLLSAGAQKIFAPLGDVIGKDFDGVLRRIWCEPFASAALHQFRTTLTTGAPYHSTRTVEHRADIDKIEAYDWRIERISLPTGKYGVVCHYYDLTEREQHEQHIKLLMREVQHRSKNMLSVILSIARHTRSDDYENFLKRFSDRLYCLSANQDLLVEGGWTGVDLEKLIRSQLVTFVDEIDSRISIAGPAINIDSSAAQGIGMALHELSTNASKYGSLSNNTGTVAISWNVVDGCLSITWEEKGGPPVDAPTKKGFGSTVIVEMCKAAVSGQVALEYCRTGLKWHLCCPTKNFGTWS